MICNNLGSFWSLQPMAFLFSDIIFIIFYISIIRIIHIGILRDQKHNQTCHQKQL